MKCANCGIEGKWILRIQAVGDNWKEYFCDNCGYYFARFQDGHTKILGYDEEKAKYYQQMDAERFKAENDRFRR